MSSGIYEILSLGMRYWFTLLGVLIVLRTFVWLWKDRQQKHRRLRSLPDAGLVGELQVIEGGDELPADTAIPLPYEGTLGFLRSCDVVIPCEGVGQQHLDFSFQHGLGLLIYPRQGQTCLVDGEEMTARSKARMMPLHHGGILQIGDVKLRVRLFAGLDAGGHSHFREDAVAELPNERFASTEDIPIVQGNAGWKPVPPQQAYPWRYQPPVQQQQPYAPAGVRQDGGQGYPQNGQGYAPQPGYGQGYPQNSQGYAPQPGYGQAYPQNGQGYTPQPGYGQAYPQNGQGYAPQPGYGQAYPQNGQGYAPQPGYGQAYPQNGQGYAPQPGYGQAYPQNGQGYTPQPGYGQAYPQNGQGYVPQPGYGQAYPQNDPSCPTDGTRPHPLQDAYGVPPAAGVTQETEDDAGEQPLHPRRAERRRRFHGKA